MPTPSERLLRTGRRALAALAQVAEQDWTALAPGLEWTRWESLEHLCDDCIAYALQVSGQRSPQDHYLRIDLPPARRQGGPRNWAQLEADATAADLLECLDAGVGLLVTVTAHTAPQHLGYHPYGLSDPEGFAAMGLVELAVHTHDVLSGTGIAFAPEPEDCRFALTRLFPDADATADDPWMELLTATGRTPDTLGSRWRWDSTLR